MQCVVDMLDALKPKRTVMVLGSAIVDMVIRVDDLPKSGGDIVGACRKTNVGGCAYNVCDVLSKLSLPFESFMPVGEGLMSDIVSSDMRARGWTMHSFKGHGDNGWCLALVEPHGERTFITMPGIDVDFQRAWLDALDLGRFDAFYLSGYQAAGPCGQLIYDALRASMRDDAILFFDPGPRAMQMPRSMLDAYLDLNALVTVNSHEARLMTDTVSTEAAARKLALRTGQAAVVTDGARGAALAEGDSVRMISGYPVEPVDTVGSGDAHTGGVIAGWLCGFALEDCVRLGNAVASVVTAREGAATAPTAQELYELHR